MKRVLKIIRIFVAGNHLLIMTESDFYSRLLLIAVFGFLFIFVMIKAARRCTSEVQSRHWVAKGFGILLFVLSTLLMISFVVSLGKIEFPEASLEQPLTSHSIIRHSSQSLIWGYPTYHQNMAFSAASGCLELLALGLYFFLFKSSDTSKGMKIWKVILCIILLFFMQTATDFHYFDTYEFVSPIMTIILMVVFSRTGNVKTPDRVTQVDNVQLAENHYESEEVIYSEEDVKL